jgi:hypothetical protein
LPLALTLPWWIKLILGVLLAAGGGIALYHFFNWGQAVTQGLQQVAPGLGTMVGSLGLMFSLLPPLLMLMMFTWMLSTFTRLLGE